MRSVRTRTGALCLLLAVSLPVAAQTKAAPAKKMAAAPTATTTSKLPKITFTDQKLDNGLRVIIAPDNAAPVFAISVTYNTGSRNEKQGRTGFAHLFEHMMFQGSQNVGKNEHSFLVQTNGGSMNGSTNNDQTNYYEALPKNQLDLALFLEADRMKALNVTQQNFENQRNAVQEERRLRVDNQPYGKSGEELQSMAYDHFPYHHSVIGSMDDLNAAKIEDIQEFFRTYYAPNNAVLVLVGDLNPTEALAKVKKYFGSIPKQAAPPPVEENEPDHTAERRKTMTDQLARIPLYQAAYNIPKGDTPENYALQVLANVLTGGRTSRLYQKLVREQQIAQSVNMFAQARRGPSLFSISAQPARGAKLEDIEKAIYDEIENVKQNGITEKELERARISFLRQQIQQRQGSLGLANRIATLAVFFNDPGLINTSVDKYNAVTPEQVKAAAQKYLVPEHRSVVITTPAGRGSAASAAGMQ